MASMTLVKVSPSAFCLALALHSLCTVRARGAECGDDAAACTAFEESSQTDMEVAFLQRGLALGAQVAASGAECNMEPHCSSGISTSCTNGRCQVSCSGKVLCADLSCPKGISTSCSNGDCKIDCRGGGAVQPTAQGSCSRYQCNTGISTSCSNGLCTLTCGGIEFCTDLSCPRGISTSCSNGDCTIDCKGGGNQCATGSCAVYSDPHVAGFDSFPQHAVPSHLVLSQLDACASEVRPIDVNSYESGDFWLVRSDLVQLQGRFVLTKEFVPDHAAVGAVAVSGPILDGKKLIIGTGNAVTWDGRPLQQGNTLDLNLTRGPTRISSHSGPVVDGKPSNAVRAKLPLDVELYLVQFPKYLDTKITLPKHMKVDGECGNFNGETEDDTEAAVRGRMGGLQVAAQDVLF